MGGIMNAVLVGCVQIENADSGARTISRELGECPRNSGNCWACREFLRVGPIWGLSRDDAAKYPAPPEVGSPVPLFSFIAVSQPKLQCRETATLTILLYT